MDQIISHLIRLCEFKDYLIKVIGFFIVLKNIIIVPLKHKLTNLCKQYAIEQL